MDTPAEWGSIETQEKLELSRREIVKAKAAIQRELMNLKEKLTSRDVIGRVVLKNRELSNQSVQMAYSELLEEGSIGVNDEGVLKLKFRNASIGIGL